MSYNSSPHKRGDRTIPKAKDHKPFALGIASWGKKRIFSVYHAFERETRKNHYKFHHDKQRDRASNENLKRGLLSIKGFRNVLFFFEWAQQYLRAQTAAKRKKSK